MANELIIYLETRALVLPSGVRDKIAKDYGVPVALIQMIEQKVRAAIIEHIRRLVLGDAHELIREQED